MTGLFWFLIFSAIYSYLVYPILLRGIPAKRRSIIEHADLPLMTVIIAARNEENAISGKLEDTFAQRYPEGALQIIVVSDASDDGTDDIVAKFSSRGVLLVRQDIRRGKEAAQLCGIKHSTGNVLVFTDVAAYMAPMSLERIGKVLCQPGIGAVSSEDVLDAQSVSGEGIYVRYEMALRRLESERAGLVGLSGSFFAARREVCDPWPTNVPSDFSIALNCARKGYRAVSDADVKGVYSDLYHPSKEFSRKRRTVLRGMSALFHHVDVLSPRKYGMFSFQVWGHKVMRWAVPWSLAGIAIVTVIVIIKDQGPVYILAAYAQAALYGLALLGAMAPTWRKVTGVRIAYYFLQVNLASALALLDFLSGRRIVTWNPSRR